MNEFRFKTRYAGSKRMQSLFEIAFYLVVTAFFLVVESALFASDRTYTWPAGALVITLFGLFFCFVFILVCASFTLWIGMLQFLFKYDGRRTGAQGGMVSGCLFRVVVRCSRLLLLCISKVYEANACCNGARFEQ